MWGWSASCKMLLIFGCGAEAELLGLGDRESELDVQTERKADDGIVMCKTVQPG